MHIFAYKVRGETYVYATLRVIQVTPALYFDKRST